MRWWSLALLVGCYRPSAELCEGPCATDGGPTRLDGPLPDGAVCVGTFPLDFCYPVALSETFELAGDLDTDSCPQPAQVKNGTMICAIEKGSINVAATGVRVIGSLPLVLVGTQDVEILGGVDLSGSISARAAGADPEMLCDPSAAGTSFAGAGGGSFASRGGKGSTDLLGHGGLPGDTFPLTFRGGCAGGDTVAGDRGGGGGGAIYVASAAIRIAASGGINAGGGGGGPSTGDPTAAGGTGGGSGGYIGIDAPAVTFLGPLIATGGGGGGGTCKMATGGEGGTPTLFNPSAMGGPSALDAGRGGDGATDSAAADGGNAMAGSMCGGGGGGGGRGTIQLFKTINVCPSTLCTPLPVNNT